MKYPVKEIKMPEQPEEGSTTTANKVKESYEQARKKASELGHKADEEFAHLKEKLNTYSHGADEFLDELAAYIRENPQRAAMIAGVTGLSIGILIGLVLRGRR